MFSRSPVMSGNQKIKRIYKDLTYLDQMLKEGYLSKRKYMG